MKTYSTLTRYEYFRELFDELNNVDQISLANLYFSECDPDNYIHDFEEEFLNEYFSSPADAASAVFFGNIQSWNDPYIRFNGYGNLVSMSEREAAERAQMVVNEIYENIDFSDYIDMSEYDDQNEETEE